MLPLMGNVSHFAVNSPFPPWLALEGLICPVPLCATGAFLCVYLCMFAYECLTKSVLSISARMAFWLVNLYNLLCDQWFMRHLHSLNLNLKGNKACVRIFTNCEPSSAPNLFSRNWARTPYCVCRPAPVLFGPDRLSLDANALRSQRWAQPDDAEEDEPGKPHTC